MGSKSKIELMKSYQKHKTKATKRLKTLKRENAQDIISKSIFNNHLNQSVMSTIRNHVQLIGNLGDAPKITDLENGRKVARFSLATNDYYKNAKGEKVQSTEWHTIVAWGKTAEIVESYVDKGREIAIVGKLKNRSYEAEDGSKKYVTEVEANEILLLGNKPNK
jgi:hypothetical protein